MLSNLASGLIAGKKKHQYGTSVTLTSPLIPFCAPKPPPQMQIRVWRSTKLASRSAWIGY